MEYPAEQLLHERLLVCQSHGTQWAIVTPDLDVYVEDLAQLSLGILRADGRPPPWAARRRSYCFEDLDGLLTNDEWADVFEDGIVQAELEAAGRGNAAPPRAASGTPFARVAAALRSAAAAPPRASAHGRRRRP